MATVTWKGRLPGRRQKKKGKETRRSRGRKAREPTQGCPWNQTNWEFGIRKIQNEGKYHIGEKSNKLRIWRKQRIAKPHVGEREKKIPMTARPSGCPIASPEMTFNEIGFPRTPGLSYFRGKRKLYFFRKFEFSQEILVRGILGSHQYWHISSWSAQGEAPEEKVDLQFGVLTP